MVGMRDRDVTVETFGILLAGLLEAERAETAPISQRRRYASGVYPVGERSDRAEPKARPES